MQQYAQANVLKVLPKRNGVQSKHHQKESKDNTT